MAEVSCATSFDERFDPANVLNSNKNSFWISTGLYPQELTFTFAQAKVVNAVNFQTSGAKKIVIEGCQTATGNAFKPIGESKGKRALFNQSCRARRQRNAKRLSQNFEPAARGDDQVRDPRRPR